MPEIGQCSPLRILRESPHGFHLDGENLGDILLPGPYIPKGAVPGDKIEVFVYRDSEDRLVATTETPLAKAGEFAALRVVSSNRRLGAFLDWGLSKDLLLPMREQSGPVHPGETVVVFIYVDAESDRIVASARLRRYLDLTVPLYEVGQRVDLLVASRSPLGFNAIVNGSHSGLLYESELSAPLDIGQRLPGFVRSVREDGKIDLGLDPAGYRRVGPLTEQILALLDANGGKLALDDESSPAEIREIVGTSKKAFKQALGALYRQQRIQFEKPGIRLVTKPSQSARS